MAVTKIPFYLGTVGQVELTLDTGVDGMEHDITYTNDKGETITAYTDTKGIIHEEFLPYLKTDNDFQVEYQLIDRAINEETTEVSYEKKLIDMKNGTGVILETYTVHNRYINDEIVTVISGIVSEDNTPLPYNELSELYETNSFRQHPDYRQIIELDDFMSHLFDNKNKDKIKALLSSDVDSIIVTPLTDVGYHINDVIAPISFAHELTQLNLRANQCEIILEAVNRYHTFKVMKMRYE